MVTRDDEPVVPLNTAETAARFRVDPKTVSRWRRDGLIKGFKTPGGREWRFWPDDIDRLLKGGDQHGDQDT